MAIAIDLMRGVAACVGAYVVVGAACFRVGTALYVLQSEQKTDYGWFESVGALMQATAKPTVSEDARRHQVWVFVGPCARDWFRSVVARRPAMERPLVIWTACWNCLVRRHFPKSFPFTFKNFATTDVSGGSEVPTVSYRYFLRVPWRQAHPFAARAPG
jgi:hypothetical protein